MTKSIRELTVSMSNELVLARQDRSLIEMRVTRACMAEMNADATGATAAEVWLSATEYSEVYPLRITGIPHSRKCSTSARLCTG